ncbi:MAG TPA: hypothetical protein VNZ67_14095, partial [bacterium]|nr:hypothetical protein [bacterium]
MTATARLPEELAAAYAQGRQAAEEDTGAPAEVPLYVYRGDSRSWGFRLWEDDDRTQPYDLSQVTSVRAQIRRSPDDRVAVELVCQITPPNWIFVHLSA